MNYNNIALEEMMDEIFSSEDYLGVDEFSFEDLCLSSLDDTIENSKFSIENTFNIIDIISNENIISLEGIGSKIWNFIVKIYTYIVKAIKNFLKYFMKYARYITNSSKMKGNYSKTYAMLKKEEKESLKESIVEFLMKNKKPNISLYINQIDRITWMIDDMNNISADTTVFINNIKDVYQDFKKGVIPTDGLNISKIENSAQNMIRIKTNLEERLKDDVNISRSSDQIKQKMCEEFVETGIINYALDEKLFKAYLSDFKRSHNEYSNYVKKISYQERDLKKISSDIDELLIKKSSFKDLIISFTRTINETNTKLSMSIKNLLDANDYIVILRREFIKHMENR